MDILNTLFYYSEYVFWFVLVFTIIVFIHEFGHYYVARLNKVDVEKFSIGFGPVLCSVTDKNNTKWQLSAIPLGGYVKFAGEMYAEEDHTNKNIKLFMNKNALQKASIVFAGPLANFLLSFIIFTGIFFFYGKSFSPAIIGSIDDQSPALNYELKKYDKILSINNIRVNSFEEITNILENNKSINNFNVLLERDTNIFNINVVPQLKSIETFIGTEKIINYIGIRPLIIPKIGKVIKNSPAEQAGLLKGDTVIKINNKNIIGARQIIETVGANLKQEITLTIIRGNKEFTKSITPQALSKDKNTGQIGIIFKKTRNKLNFKESIYNSFLSIYEVSTKTLLAFSEIIFGKRDHCEVGGPILIAKVSNDIANTDIVSFIALIALISINLGLINLFPLPLLDGGHFFTYISEFIIGKPIGYKVFKKVQFAGVIIIFSLMSFSILNDIYCRVLN